MPTEVYAECCVLLFKEAAITVTSDIGLIAVFLHTIYRRCSPRKLGSLTLQLKMFTFLLITGRNCIYFLGMNQMQATIERSTELKETFF